MNGSTPARISPGKGSAIHAHVLRNFRVDPLAELEPIIKNKFKTNYQKPGKNRRRNLPAFWAKNGYKKKQQVGKGNTFIL